MATVCHSRPENRNLARLALSKAISAVVDLGTIVNLFPQASEPSFALIYFRVVLGVPKCFSQVLPVGVTKCFPRSGNASPNNFCLIVKEQARWSLRDERAKADW